MRIEIAAFTSRGMRLGKRLQQELAQSGDAVRLCRVGAGGQSLGEWVDGVFDAADALVFVGAAGIAVRAVAPKLVSKTTDPAVVAVDDCGRFAVSLLSGHIGGANELAERVALAVGATPVVTTATDASGVFAVDVWARKQGLKILNPAAIKTVSAKLLDEKTVRLRSAFPVNGAFPDGVAPTDGDADIVVDIRAGADSGALRLVPPAAVLGIGCRKGTDAQTLAEAFSQFCGDAAIESSSFASVCSIDLKKDEPGLLEFCRTMAFPFTTFSADALNRVPGDFSGSDFVKTVAGVDNVCERAAVLGSGGTLIVQKTVVRGVAMAAALIRYGLDF